jgi:hypothetical protein
MRDEGLGAFLYGHSYFDYDEEGGEDYYKYG